jgi:hypothetical protein
MEDIPVEVVDPIELFKAVIAKHGKSTDAGFKLAADIAAFSMTCINGLMQVIKLQDEVAKTATLH